MKSSWLRNLAWVLVLVYAGAQPGLASPLVAGAFALETHESDHPHSVVLQSDGDHVDIVLSHDATEAHDHPDVPGDHDHPASFTEGDHVVHVVLGDAANTAARRTISDQTPSLAITSVVPISAKLAWVPRLPSRPHARGVNHLETVVLRL